MSEAERVSREVGHFCNSMTADHKGFCEAMKREHEVVQAEFTKLCFKWIEEFSRTPKDGRSDKERLQCKVIARTFLGTEYEDTVAINYNADKYRNANGIKVYGCPKCRMEFSEYENETDICRVKCPHCKVNLIWHG